MKWAVWYDINVLNIHFNFEDICLITVDWKTEYLYLHCAGDVDYVKYIISRD